MYTYYNISHLEFWQLVKLFVSLDLFSISCSSLSRKPFSLQTECGFKNKKYLYCSETKAALFLVMQVKGILGGRGYSCLPNIYRSQELTMCAFLVMKVRRCLQLGNSSIFYLMRVIISIPPNEKKSAQQRTLRWGVTHEEFKQTIKYTVAAWKIGSIDKADIHRTNCKYKILESVSKLAR